jgi:hypothetical protein
LNGVNSMKISSLYPYPIIFNYVGVRGRIPLRSPKTLVGIEIELEHLDRNTTLYTPSWKTFHDGSLKEEGKEFVSCPIQTQYLEIELIKLFNSLHSYKITQRCSIHVHLNVRDFKSKDLFNFLLLYLVFERNLYRFSGDRWNNIHCVPLYSFKDFIVPFLKKLNSGHVFPSWKKYHGLNLSPIWGGESSLLGTIEFRHMGGCTSVEKIMDWINLIVSLRDAAKSMNTETIIQYIKTLNTSKQYEGFALLVFKDWEKLLTESSFFEEDMSMCITKAKELLYEAKKLKTNRPHFLISKGE